MIRNYSNVLLNRIVVTVLVLAPTTYFFDPNTMKATASNMGPISLMTPTATALVQNCNTENHFIIDKTQFKKAPEFTGITGFINTPNMLNLQI